MVLVMGCLDRWTGGVSGKVEGRVSCGWVLYSPQLIVLCCVSLVPPWKVKLN